jgi:hypothetical protein
MGPGQSSGSLPLIAVLGLAGAALIGCLASALGPLLIPALLACGGLALLGGLHYWLWGHAITGARDEDERDEAR